MLIIIIIQYYSYFITASTESTSVDMRATAVMDTTLTAESMTTVQSQSEQQNTFITTSTAEVIIERWNKSLQYDY